MFVDLIRFRSGVEKYANVDFNYSFTEEQLLNSGIIKLDNCLIQGEIYDEYGNFILNVKIKGNMILPCNITLNPVDYPFEINITEDLTENFTNLIEKSENTIDIFPIIWENILTEVPLKIVSDNLDSLITKGEGWQFITEK